MFDLDMTGPEKAKAFDGKVTIHLVVDNYYFGDIATEVMQKLAQLDFIVASTISRGFEENE